MTNKQLFRGGLAALAGIALCTLSSSFLTAQEANVKVYAAIKGDPKLRIVQTNSAGDNVSIIDPATNKVVGEIKGIEATHGITVAKDGSRIYITRKHDTLVVVDGKTLQVIKRIPLSGVTQPRSTDSRWTKDLCVDQPPVGRRLRLPADQGRAERRRRRYRHRLASKVKTISIKGGIHDLYITPDGKYVVAGANRHQVRLQIGLRADEPGERDRHADQRDRLDVFNKSIALSDGHLGETRRLYREDIRSNWRR